MAHHIVHPYACFIILLACVLSCTTTDAFVGGHHGKARIQSGHQNQNIQTLIIRNTHIHVHERISSATITLSAKKDEENDTKKERTYTKIDDGSPIGVAIVLLGLLGNIYFPGALSAINFFSDEKYVWIVLATASTAAGLARLLRYYRDKNEE